MAFSPVSCIIFLIMGLSQLGVFFTAEASTSNLEETKLVVEELMLDVKQEPMGDGWDETSEHGYLEGCFFFLLKLYTS